MGLAIFAIVVGVVALVFLIVLLNFFGLWLRATLAGARIKMSNLIGMRLRIVNPAVIVDAKIMAIKAGLDVDENLLEAHYLARGNVPNVIRALIAANKAQIKLTFAKATAIDLAGRDVLDAVRTSVNPKVIDCPDARSGRPNPSKRSSRPISPLPILWASRSNRKVCVVPGMMLTLKP